MSGGRGMSHIKCKICGRISPSMGGEMCSDCTVKDTAKLLELRAYLRTNPDKGIDEVASSMSITTGRIIGYLESGKINSTPGLDRGQLLKCARCSKPITMGTMCNTCRLSFNEGVRELKEESRNKRDLGIGMHSKRLTGGSDDRRGRR